MMRALVLQRTFHVQRSRRGRKGLRAGEAPSAPERRTPRVARLMALAIRFEHLIASGQVVNQAELARLGGVSRARLTQVMNLLLLAPDIQEELLFLSCGPSERPTIYLRQLQPIVAIADWNRQRQQWLALGRHRM